MIPIAVAALLEQGLSLLGNAVLAKGKDVVEKELGVKLPDGEKPIDPETAVKLKELEIKHEEWLLDAAVRQAEVELKHDAQAYADTANARGMQISAQESANASWLQKNIVPLLALVVVIGGGMMLYWADEQSLQMALVGIITLVLGFYFGTSASSQQHSADFAKLTFTKEEKK